jgi:preprotein translocase subunit SecG
MYLAITLVHVVVCFVLILVVLLQSGKAADLAGAFGGMGSQTAFGARGAATLLSKATTICAVIFMLTSLTLAIFAMRYRGSGSVLGKAPQSSQPAAPAGTIRTVPPGQKAPPQPAQPQQQQPPSPAPPAGKK